jgi:hypothetical protein
MKRTASRRMGPGYVYFLHVLSSDRVVPWVPKLTMRRLGNLSTRTLK